MNGHDLTLTADGGGTCACGETFTDGDASDAFESWQEHVETAALLVAVRDHFLAERAARTAGEAVMVRLLDLGLSARFVADAVGTDEHNAPMVSATLVQRIARNAHAQHPRRRSR